jgi:hypothetical protein
MKTRVWMLCALVMACPATVGAVWAQTVPATASATSTTSAQDDPAVLIPAEPDVVVVNLPTALRMPLFKGNFRITHRFGGNLRNGSFGQQADNLFGLDQGAIIGFEFRMAVARNVQAAFYRSGFEKTIQFSGQYDVLRQRGAMPVSVSALVSIEGTRNFREKYAPAAGAVISRRFGTRLAGYVTPMWVDNTDASLTAIDPESAPAGSAARARGTSIIGLGGRVRVAGSTYVAAEVALRAGGYAPDQPAFGFSVEKRVGGHTFSLTFTNAFGTTFAQVARGGAAQSLYLGFNLSRKFF